MRIILFLSLAVVAMTACNQQANRDEVEAEVAAEVVADMAAEEAAMSDTSSVNEAIKAVNKLKESAEKTDFVPTGDIEKDAQAIVDMQLRLAEHETDGNATQAERDNVTGALVKAGQHYSTQGQQEEFQKALGEKMKQLIEKMR